MTTLHCGTMASRVTAAFLLGSVTFIIHSSRDALVFHVGYLSFSSLGMIGGNLALSLHGVKVFILDTFGPDLDAVANFIKSFPCLEKLYIMSSLAMDMKMKNMRSLNPQDHIECLNLSLREVVLKGYQGKRRDVNFAKFFVLNAKVLEVMEFGVHNTSSEKWRADQHRLLRLDSRASRNARFYFRSEYLCTKFTCSKHDHVLSMADPVGGSCRICGHNDISRYM